MASAWTWLLGVSFVIYLIFKKFPWLKYDFQMLKAMFPSILYLIKCQRNNTLIIDIFEKQAKENSLKTFLVYQGNNYSYKYMDQMANKVARVGQRIGLKAGDTAAILIYNEPAFIWTFLGLTKLGVKVAFLNFNLRSNSLLHCFNLSSSKALIIGQGEQLVSAIEEIYDDLKPQGLPVYVQGTSKFPDKFKSFDELVEQASSEDISNGHRMSLTIRDTVCYVYTSGTTGMPKAAVVSHDKFLKASVAIQQVGMHKDDILYTPLPLYHSAAGIIGLGNVINAGATLVLRNKFSATHFWEDCVESKATVVQYIGELCRYLVAKPRSKFDTAHQVRIAFGNGLRRDVWSEFVDRFRIPVIGEFYGATEGNLGFLNLLNKFGCVGRASPLLSFMFPCAFIKYDIETALPVRNTDGFCVKVKLGEPGLMISLIKKTLEFDGYKGNKDLSNERLLHDVFKKGDKWYNSGDLLVQDKDYFIYFHDRIGDTFRWKGENVSTTELSNVISELDWIEDANVYGVAIPGHDGRAGMAAITLLQDQELNDDRLKQLYSHCEKLMPSYAWPRFLRFQATMEVTNTFKQKKVDLVKEGCDPEKIRNDRLFVIQISAKTFVPLTPELYEDVKTNKLRV